MKVIPQLLEELHLFGIFPENPQNGVKRVLDLKTISKGTLDMWDGTNVGDLRKIALEFAGTKLDKVLALVLSNLCFRVQCTSNQ